MQQPPLRDEILKAYENMPPRLQQAARFLLDQPREVALLSMREQARQAGVQPATMTRLAKHLGLEGYDDIREAYAAAIRDDDSGFADKARSQVADQALRGDGAIAATMLRRMGRQIERLASPETQGRIIDVADLLASARRIYCLGLRSSHSVAWHIHYVLTLIGRPSVYLDGIAATGADALIHANEQDVLFTATIRPYASHSLELAAYAAARGIAVAAITDSEVSPVARIARHAVLVPTDSPAFFHSQSPAFAVAEVIGAILVGRGGETALAALRDADRHLEALNIFDREGGGRKA